jgi:hypothetical protein
MSFQKSTFWLHHKMKYDEAPVHSITPILLWFIYFFFPEPVPPPAHFAGLTWALKWCGFHSGKMHVFSQTLPRIPYYRPTVGLAYDSPLRYAISGYTKSRAIFPTTRRKKHLERCHENLLIKHNMGKNWGVPRSMTKSQCIS